MKKIFKSILVLLIAICGVLTLGVKAEAPNTLTINGKAGLQPSGTGMFFYKKSVAYNGKTVYVYCVDLVKRSSPASGATVKRSGELGAGYAYIVSNGYPYDNNTNMSANDRYAATQIAMWWYVDYLNGIENKVTPRSEYKNSNGQSYDPLQNFKNGKYKTGSPAIYNMAYSLKEGAKKASYSSASLKINLKDAKMQMSSDGKYYESGQIGVDASNVSGNYTVSLNSAPKGTIVTGTNGSQKTSFAVGEKFIVKVPVKEITSLKSDFTISVTANGSVNKAYKYVASSSLQSLAAVFPAGAALTDSAKLNYMTTKVKISKQDITTAKNLPGAKLEIKDANGKVVASWVSTEEDYYIDALPEGKYTLTETSAPDGYKLSSEVVEFEVIAGEITEVLMYNAPEDYVNPTPEAQVTQTVIVPDTASKASIIMYVLGALIIIVGTVFVVRNARKEKTSK